MRTDPCFPVADTIRADAASRERHTISWMRRTPSEKSLTSEVIGVGFELCVEPARECKRPQYTRVTKDNWHHLRKVLSWISSGLLIERASREGKEWPGQRTTRLEAFHILFGSIARHVRQPRAQLAARIPESVFTVVAGVVISHGAVMCSCRGRYSRAIYATRQAASPCHKSSWTTSRFQGQDDRSKG